MSNTFTCAACGGTFEKARSDDEALSESKDLWGSFAPEDMAVICGPCFEGGVDDALAEHADLGYPKSEAEAEIRRKAKDA